jgi:4-diphosphocytidyl-2-C-methyl-D-erythritol kinase
LKVLSLRTAAKVNLCLPVLQTVGIWDRIEIREDTSERIQVRASPGDVPQGEDNLCYRAAELLARHADLRRGVSIHVEKGIPMASGLGGGSSDAAATLAGLARLWELAISRDDLERIAADVGSDVPFFLRGGTWLARGRGEQLSACPTISAYLVVVAPEQRVATEQAYAALRRGAARGKRRGPTRSTQRLLDALARQDIHAVSKALHNDFERLEMRAVADALRAKADLLEAGCLGAAMSGAGSAVFGTADESGEAERIAARVAGQWPWVKVVRTVPAGESITIGEACLG